MKEKPSQSCKKKLKKRSEKKKKKLSRLAKILRRRKKQQKAALVAAESSTLLDLRPPPLEINIIELERSNYRDLSWERLPPVQMQMRPAIALPPMQTEPSSAEPIRVSVRYLSSWLPHSAPLPVVVLLVTDHPPNLRPLPPPLLNLVIPALVAQTVPAPDAPTLAFSPPQQSFQSWPELLPRRHHPAEPVCRWLAVPLARLIAEGAAAPSTPPVSNEHPTAEQPASSNENSDGNCKSKKLIGRRARPCVYLKKLIGSESQRFQSPTGGVAGRRSRQRDLAKKLWCFGKRADKNSRKQHRWLVSDRTVRRLERSANLQYHPQLITDQRVGAIVSTTLTCLTPPRSYRGIVKRPRPYGYLTKLIDFPTECAAAPSTPPVPAEDPTTEQPASGNENSDGNHKHSIVKRLKPRGYLTKRIYFPTECAAAPSTSPVPAEDPTAEQPAASNENSDGNRKSKKSVVRRLRLYMHLKKLIKLRRFQSPTGNGDSQWEGRLEPHLFYRKVANVRSKKPNQTPSSQVTAPQKGRTLLDPVLGTAEKSRIRSSDLSSIVSDADRRYNEALINIIQAMAAASTRGESVGSICTSRQSAVDEWSLFFSTVLNIRPL